jgi:hypothetical protein
MEADELSDTTIYDLYSQLGQNDTPKLLEQPYRVDTEHDCPTGAGNSIDRKTIYIDRILYQEVMDGAFKKTELTPQQIIGRWLDHEHSEICLSHGDNGVDVYQPCHNRSLVREHEGVLTILRSSSPAACRKAIENYEAVIWPGLVRCYHRPITKPPKDYWCGPLADHPTDRDEEILKRLTELGVIDAPKYSKYEVHYGFGEKKCEDCSGWFPGLISQEHGRLAGCHRINGLVREGRWCDMWREKGKKA